MKKIFEVFRAGQHKDSAGVDHSYTEQDLDTIVSSYDPAKHNAPVVIGHPKTDAPAYGWVDRVFRKGKSLFAEIETGSDEFVEWLKKGLYKQRSIALYDDGSLRHIGFLGAQPPAIKGLEQFQFADSNAKVLEFAEDTGWLFRDIGRALSSIRDLFIEKYGTDTADNTLPSYLVDGLKNASIEISPSNGFAQVSDSPPPIIDDHNNPSQGGSMDLVQALARIKELETAQQQFSEETTSLKAQLATALATIETEKNEVRRKSHTEFAERLVKEGRLAPNMRDSVVIALESVFQGNKGVQFAEGQVNPYEKMKTDLAASPVIVEFAELAKKQTAPAAPQTLEGKEIAKRAMEFQEAEAKEGRTISIGQAVNHVMKQ
jgi:hypothetical protein